MRKMNLLLIAGQSNAVGTSVTGPLEGYEFSNVSLYQAGEFTGRNEALQNVWLRRIRPNMGYTPEHSGIELGICSVLRDEEPYGIIRYAYGTTNLIRNWQPESLWKKIPVSMAESGFCFLQWKNTFLRAIQSLQLPYRVRGLIFMQGESDAYDRDGAMQYAENLRRLMHDIRQFIGIESLPVLLGEIATPVSKHAPFAEIVREQQREFCRGDDHAVFVPSKDLRLQDGWHYEIKDVITLGERFGRKAKKLFK